MSHPVWVRGLKLAKGVRSGDQHGSHPVWVRGLKHRMARVARQEDNVAPRVGAWIETWMMTLRKARSGSHPVWVRGLKRDYGLWLSGDLQVAPRVGAWIET